MLMTGIILIIIFIIPVCIYTFGFILPIVDDSEQKQEKTDVDSIEKIKESIDLLNEIKLDELSKEHYYAAEDIIKSIEFLEEEKKKLEEKKNNRYV